MSRSRVGRYLSATSLKDLNHKNKGFVAESDFLKDGCTGFFNTICDTNLCCFLVEKEATAQDSTTCLLTVQPEVLEVPI